MTDVLCVLCKAPVPKARHCYVHPVCYACLPPPPLPIAELACMYDDVAATECARYYRALRELLEACQGVDMNGVSDAIGLGFGPVLDAMERAQEALEPTALRRQQAPGKLRSGDEQ